LNTEKEKKRKKERKKKKRKKERERKRMVPYIHTNHGFTNFQKSRSHIKILSNQTVIQSKFHTDKDSQILGTTIQNLVTLAPLAYSEFGDRQKFILVILYKIMFFVYLHVYVYTERERHRKSKCLKIMKNILQKGQETNDRIPCKVS
jgi:hypothetical protein